MAPPPLAAPRRAPNRFTANPFIDP